MTNEKEFLREFIDELKRFFRLKPQEREKVALDLNDWAGEINNYYTFKDWQKKINKHSSEENLKISKETANILGSLTVIHHYAEDPKGHDEMIRSILVDAEKILRKLDKNKG